MRRKLRQDVAAALAIFYAGWAAPSASGYAFNEIVPDVRQPASISGGSACPVHSHIVTAVPRTLQWSTSLGANPPTILTQDQSAVGRLNEVEQVMTQALAVWQGVDGATLHSVPMPVNRTAVQNACGSDGLNSICFDQADLAFTPGSTGV